MAVLQLGQPHTTNSTENRFSQQVRLTSNNLFTQGQAAILKNHDWLFMSTFSGTNFDRVVQRLHPNNVSTDITVDLQQGSCTLPQDPSSTYYKGYGFKDWTITDDEILYGIFSTYRYFYGATPSDYLRVLAIDVSDDWTWKCLDSYDISPLGQYGDYNGISYDRVTDKIWVAHGQQRSLMSYEFGENGQFTRGQDTYSFMSNAAECGNSTKLCLWPCCSQ